MVISNQRTVPIIFNNCHATAQVFQLRQSSTFGLRNSLVTLAPLGDKANVAGGTDRENL